MPQCPSDMLDRSMAVYNVGNTNYHTKMVLSKIMPTSLISLHRFWWRAATPIILTSTLRTPLLTFVWMSHSLCFPVGCPSMNELSLHTCNFVLKQTRRIICCHTAGKTLSSFAWRASRLSQSGLGRNTHARNIHVKTTSVEEWLNKLNLLEQSGRIDM